MGCSNLAMIFSTLLMKSEASIPLTLLIFVLNGLTLFLTGAGGGGGGGGGGGQQWRGSSGCSGCAGRRATAKGSRLAMTITVRAKKL